VHHFALRFATTMGKRIKRVPDDTLAALQAYHWPGNVRELENVIERAVIITDTDTLTLGEWPPPSQSAAPPPTPSATLEDVQRQHILATLEQTNWRVSGEGGAAERLGLKPTTLESRMKKLGIVRRP
jgi:transcriptional regulator with GAF, ATPase, and Fis domain